jgi:hypothetical protein
MASTTLPEPHPGCGGRSCLTDLFHIDSSYLDTGMPLATAVFCHTPDGVLGYGNARCGRVYVPVSSATSDQAQFFPLRLAVFYGVRPHSSADRELDECAQCEGVIRLYHCLAKY